MTTMKETEDGSTRSDRAYRDTNWIKNNININNNKSICIYKIVTYYS